MCDIYVGEDYLLYNDLKSYSLCFWLQQFMASNYYLDNEVIQSVNQYHYVRINGIIMHTEKK